MSKKDKHITRKEDFLKYSANKMSRDERNAFEKKLQKDTFDYEASEGFSLISSDEANIDLLKLSFLIRKRSKSGNKLIWYRIAASVAFLAIVSTVFYTVIKNRIDKGTGQLIVSESTSPQKEENDLSKLQNISPQQPADKNLTIAGADRNQKITKSPIKDVENLNKSTSPEYATVQIEKPKSIDEISDLVTYDVSAPTTRSVSENNEMILHKEKLESMEGQNLINGPSMKKSLRGIVLSSEDSTPILGVTVMVKGTKQRTITDIHGLFTLPAPQDSAAILVAQFIGMKSKEIKLKDSSNVKIEMETDVPSLEEVVVVGYGSQYKSGINRSQTIKDQSQILSSHPIPINGPDGFNEYIRKNQIFPSTNLKISRARVILNFLVRTDGTMDSINVVKSPGEEFSVEAIRLLKEGPGWIPATQNGEKVIEAVQVRILLNSTKE
jgi:hypothetical protein